MYVCVYVCICMKGMWTGRTCVISVHLNRCACMYVCMYVGDVDRADLCYRRALVLELNRCACMYVRVYVCVHLR
jgi:hypothetical protein